MVEALSMGPHGFYVWTSYGAITLLLILCYVLPISKRRKITAELLKFYRSNPDK